MPALLSMGSDHFPGGFCAGWRTFPQPMSGRQRAQEQADARFSLGRASRYHLSPYFQNIKMEGGNETGWRDFISGCLVKQLRGIGAVWGLDREFWSTRVGGSRAERFVIGCLRNRCRALLG